MFCLLCIHATFALFFWLVVQFEFEFFEFEFELNSFGPFRKRKSIGKPFSAQPAIGPFSFAWPSFSSGPVRTASLARTPRPSPRLYLKRRPSALEPKPYCLCRRRFLDLPLACAPAPPSPLPPCSRVSSARSPAWLLHSIYICLTICMPGSSFIHIETL